ncbi:ATP-binding cassette domain-containing protein [Phyllobacterium salinisoli]|uniref:ATP-binding cassette domain-containing protein n=1 Tax=Phyllobacterium salinisoli TaxID=1899321 RepID=A0A368JYZ5_9HYPH|nr:ATP-binding cassette domain-containing protein [Phyllobacterium salinisoli]RCS21382.1 ATP-binding cassette domain-containing protein [Phyllobacterium salinisoli]
MSSFRAHAENLDGIDIDVEPGECIAIVGPSGCGKTTLLKIMSGLISPTAGKVLVDGHDINGIGLSNYRRMTASVLQADRLFAGTIADNIALFDQEADQKARVNGPARRCPTLYSLEDALSGLWLNRTDPNLSRFEHNRSFG